MSAEAFFGGFSTSGTFLYPVGWFPQSRLPRASWWLAPSSATVGGPRPKPDRPVLWLTDLPHSSKGPLARGTCCHKALMEVRGQVVFLSAQMFVERMGLFGWKHTNPSHRQCVNILSHSLTGLVYGSQSIAEQTSLSPDVRADVWLVIWYYSVLACDPAVWCTPNDVITPGSYLTLDQPQLSAIVWTSCPSGAPVNALSSCPEKT